MIALDTSILARYILNDSPLERDAAEGLMSRNDCCVGWTVLVELCWVLESNARLSRNEVAESLSIIASSDFIVVPDDTALKWAIERYGKVEVIAEIPWLDTVTPQALMAIEPELDLAKLAKPLP